MHLDKTPPPLALQLTRTPPATGSIFASERFRHPPWRRFPPHVPFTERPLDRERRQPGRNCSPKKRHGLELSWTTPGPRCGAPELLTGTAIAAPTPESKGLDGRGAVGLHCLGSAKLEEGRTRGGRTKKWRTETVGVPKLKSVTNPITVECHWLP